jgi:hypothetical protein
VPAQASSRFWFRWSTTEQPMAPGVTFAQAVLRIPHWFLLLLSGFLPTIWLIKFSSHRRKLVGCCVKCGYDLRATPDRCPECGTIPPIKQETISN